MSSNYKRFYTTAGSLPAGINEGYPVPGPQTADADRIAASAFFTTDWAQAQATNYDFIVIGTGPTAVAFIDRALARNPQARILVLERGGYWLPVHYQMLPMAFQATTSPCTTYPWTRSAAMATTGSKFFQAGYIPVLGGRSTYWSAWCPAPDPALMRDWPRALVAVTQQPGFWEGARAFLHVTTADRIDDGVYGSLQRQLDTNLRENFKRFVPSAEGAFPAPMAVGHSEWQGVKFYKHATVGTLLGLQQRQQALAAQGHGQALALVDQCIVKRLLHDSQGTVTALETSRGPLSVGNARIVLAMGTIPPATLLMNSFGDQLPNIGKRYTGHFMSHVIARVKRSAFKDLAALELGAQYLHGKDEQGLQYHVQVSAFASSDPARDAATIAYEAPDAAAVASLAQLAGSEDYVVFVCATLGEVGENNPDNWIRPNGRRPDDEHHGATAGRPARAAPVGRARRSDLSNHRRPGQPGRGCGGGDRILDRRRRAGTGLLAGAPAGRAADPPADHRARGVGVVDRGGSGHVGRRPGLSAAWGEERLRDRRRVVSDVGVVESDVDHVRVGAGFGAEAELTRPAAATR
nr:GMC family oxidoreductase N-terminal domain-containing protein [Massilia rhizosphaerae]